MIKHKCSRVGQPSHYQSCIYFVISIEALNDLCVWPFFSFCCELILRWGHWTLWNACHNFPTILGHIVRGVRVCWGPQDARPPWAPLRLLSRALSSEHSCGVGRTGDVTVLYWKYLKLRKPILFIFGMKKL